MFSLTRVYDEYNLVYTNLSYVKTKDSIKQ